MKVLVLTVTALLTVACANQQKLMSAAKDNAKPVYDECIKEYQKTMSEEDARQACLDKLKDGYKDATAQ